MQDFNAIKVEQIMDQFTQLPHRYFMSTVWDDAYISRDQMVSDINRHHLWLGKAYNAHIQPLIGIEQGAHNHSHQIILSNKRFYEGFKKHCKDRDGKQMKRVFDGWSHGARSKQHIVGFDNKQAWSAINYTLFKHEAIPMGKMHHPNHRKCRSKRCNICLSDGKGILN